MTMPTTAWDDTLPEEEAVSMEAEHKARRSQVSRLNTNRYKFWVLDRLFFKGIKKGQTVTDARENAIQGWGLRVGIAFGAMLSIWAFALGSWLWNAVAMGQWINIVLNTLFFALCLLFIGGYLGRGARWVWRKVRRQES